MSYCNTIIVGAIGSIGEPRETANSKVVQVSIATDDRRKDEKKAIWHRVSFWGKSADAILNHFQVGSGIMVECDMRKNSFTKKDGVKVQATDLVARRWTFLNPTRKDDSAAPQNTSAGASAAPPDMEDVPF